MKRKIVKFVVISLVLGFALLVGFAQYEKQGNPLLPKSSWPPLRAAQLDNSKNAHLVIYDDIQVSQMEEGVEYWECELAVDHTNPDRLFAVSMVHTADSVKQGVRLSDLAGFYSRDGGESWIQAFYAAADKSSDDHSKREGYNDPTVCFGRDGAVHIAGMFGIGFAPARSDPTESVRESNELKKRHSVKFWKSDDSGVTWIEKSGIPRFIDRPFTVVDSTSGRQYTVGQSGQVFVFANHENSANVGEGKRMDFEFTNPRPSNPVLLRDGTVIFAAEEMAPKWLGRVRPGVARQIPTFRSSDGENFVPGTGVNTKYRARRQYKPFFSFFPRLGANPRSKQFADNVYCVWADQRDMPGETKTRDRERILVSVSRDAGTTWDYPVLISEQQEPASVDDEYLSAIPVVAVNSDGIVAVAWYDRRDLPPAGSSGRHSGWNVRARVSVDGGESWLPSVQLNKSPSQGEFDVGHTMGLAAAPNGRFHCVWIDARDMSRQLRATTFAVEQLGDNSVESRGSREN